MFDAEAIKAVSQMLATPIRISVTLSNLLELKEFCERNSDTNVETLNLTPHLKHMKDLTGAFAAYDVPILLQQTCIHRLSIVISSNPDRTFTLALFFGGRSSISSLDVTFVGDLILRDVQPLLALLKIKSSTLRSMTLEFQRPPQTPSADYMALLSAVCSEASTLQSLSLQFVPGSHPGFESALDALIQSEACANCLINPSLSATAVAVQPTLCTESNSNTIPQQPNSDAKDTQGDTITWIVSDTITVSISTSKACEFSGSLSAWVQQEKANLSSSNEEAGLVLDVSAIMPYKCSNAAWTIAKAFMEECATNEDTLHHAEVTRDTPYPWNPKHHRRFVQKHVLPLVDHNAPARAHQHDGVLRLFGELQAIAYFFNIPTLSVFVCSQVSLFVVKAAVKRGN